MNTRMIRTYSELITLKTFEERYEYLRLDGVVGEDTFGYDRYLNQKFYNSKLWKDRIRPKIILRDNGCDMGLEGYEIQGNIYIHHMNPITKDDILNMSKFLVDPEYLICLSFDTHQAITYGLEKPPQQFPIERTMNDTCPWRH